MATTEDRLVIRQLEAARGHLLARGDAEAVKSLDVILGRLGEPEPAPEASATSTPASPPPPNDLLTAREAATILGVSSVSPVWSWVRQGKLTFQTADGQHFITRESVERLLDDPVLQREHERAAEIARILAPFDATDEDLAEMYDWYETPGSQDNGE